MKIAELKRKWYDEQMRYLVVDKCLTKTDIAKAMGMIPQTLNAYDKGVNGLSDNFLDKMIEVFGLSEPQLLPERKDIKDSPDDKMKIIASQQETIARLAGVIERLTAGTKNEGQTALTA